MKILPSFRRAGISAGLLFALMATASAETFTWNKANTAPVPVYNWHWRDADNWDSAGVGVPKAGDTANINIAFTGVAPITITFADNPSVGLLNVGDTNGSKTITFGPGGNSQFLTFDNLGNEARLTKTSGNLVDFKRSVSFKDNTVFDVQEGVLSFTDNYGTIKGSGNLAVQGAGLTIFANLSASAFSNGFQGNLTVRNSGTLLINTNLSAHSTNPSGVVTVEGTGRLGGGGTLGRHTTVQGGGTLTPGSTLGGAGLLKFSSGLTLAAESKFEFALLSNTASLVDRGLAFDGVDVTGGNLSIAEGALFNVTFNGLGSAVDFTSDFWSVNQEWLVFEGADVATSLFTLGSISNDASGNAFNVTGGALGFTQAGDGLYLTYTVIPEPGTTAFLLMAGGMVAIGFRRNAIR